MAICKNEKKHRPVAAHGEPPHLLAYFGVHHVNQLISRPVPRDFESCGLISEIFLEPAFRPKSQLANAPVQAIGSNHQVEVLFRTVFEM